MLEKLTKDNIFSHLFVLIVIKYEEKRHLSRLNVIWYENMSDWFQWIKYSLRAYLDPENLQFKNSIPPALNKLKTSLLSFSCIFHSILMKLSVS
jgi:hypothetical protein